MTDGRQLYRSRDALVGGVCAGVADYSSLDPVIVRILVVVFTLASGGLLAVAYAALWAVLPKAPEVVKPLDVEPQSVHSDTYGSVEQSATPSVRSSAAQAASWRYASPYAGAAHVPPEPPLAASRRQEVAASEERRVDDTPPNSEAFQQNVSGEPSVAPTYGGWSYGWHPAEAPKAPSWRGVRAALWVGSVLLFFGIVAFAVMFVEDFLWWQYWPLILVILGIVRMVIPGDPGYRMQQFVEGLLCFSVGATLFPMALGLVAWQSFEYMLASLWPLLLMMVGLFILGGALKSPVFTLLAGVCFVAFCVGGLVWCSVPGPTTEVVFAVPYGREYHLGMNGWMR